MTNKYPQQVKPRTCFYVPHDACTPHGFIPSLVTENEPGHSPMTGGKDQLPWFWGKTHEEAQAVADSRNARDGISKTDAAEIICSSMFAKLDGIIANQVNESRFDTTEPGRYYVNDSHQPERNHDDD